MFIPLNVSVCVCVHVYLCSQASANLTTVNEGQRSRARWHPPVSHFVVKLAPREGNERERDTDREILYGISVLRIYSSINVKLLFIVSEHVNMWVPAASTWLDISH